jgi:hypothetical protein
METTARRLHVQLAKWIFQAFVRIVHLHVVSVLPIRQHVLHASAERFLMETIVHKQHVQLVKWKLLESVRIAQVHAVSALLIKQHVLLA